MGTTNLESLGFTRVEDGGIPVNNPPDLVAPIILTGTGVPTVEAPKGSVYLRADGGGQAYINTDGGTTWQELAPGGDVSGLTTDTIPIATSSTTLGDGPLSVAASVLISADPLTITGDDNDLALAGSATGDAVTLTASGSDARVPILVSPKGDNLASLYLFSDDPLPIFPGAYFGTGSDALGPGIGKLQSSVTLTERVSYDATSYGSVVSGHQFSTSIEPATDDTSDFAVLVGHVFNTDIPSTSTKSIYESYGTLFNSSYAGSGDPDIYTVGIVVNHTMQSNSSHAHAAAWLVATLAGASGGQRVLDIYPYFIDGATVAPGDDAIALYIHGATISGMSSVDTWQAMRVNGPDAATNFLGLNFTGPGTTTTLAKAINIADMTGPTTAYAWYYDGPTNGKAWLASDGSLTLEKRTGTPAKFAMFDSTGKLCEGGDAP